MTECTICEAYKKKELSILYEDGTIMVFLEGKPAAPGHIKVCTKSHVETFRDVQESIVSYLFFAASFSAMTVFEQLGAHGTNIIINEGIQGNNHACIDIIPRKTDDGLGFTWEPKQLAEEEMATVVEALKDKAFFIGKERQPKKQEPIEMKEIVERKEKKEGQEEDYQIRHIRRIP